MLDAANGSSDHDVVVIGGGIVGMSLAYGLAKSGRKITVLDEGDVAYRASRGNFALIWLQNKGIDFPSYAQWTRRSVSQWSEFSTGLEKEAGMPIALEQRGGFTVCVGEAELEKRADDMGRLAANPANQPLPFEVLDHAGLKKMLPQIGREVVGGVFCPLDGQVNPLKLFRALHAACIRLGVTYLPNSRVLAVSPGSGEFIIDTESGFLHAQKVVLAAGLDNSRLGSMVGLRVPVRPQRGQILVTEKLNRFLDYPLHNIRQSDEGGVMIGGSKEEVGLDTSTRNSTLELIAKRAVQIFPMLERARVVRMWGALRVMTPDAFPIYEQSQVYPGAYVVTCHSGVTLAAVHALSLAEHISAGTWPEHFDVFQTKRFSNVS